MYCQILPSGRISQRGALGQKKLGPVRPYVPVDSPLFVARQRPPEIARRYRERLRNEVSAADTDLGSRCNAPEFVGEAQSTATLVAACAEDDDRFRRCGIGRRQRRGDIHTAAARGAYTGKPRRSRSRTTERSTAWLPSCRLTRVMSRHFLMRIPAPSVQRHRATETSCLTVDKVITSPHHLTRQVGVGYRPKNMVRLDRAALVSWPADNCATWSSESGSGGGNETGLPAEVMSWRAGFAAIFSELDR